jgi:signal transduction histidine kinase
MTRRPALVVAAVAALGGGAVTVAVSLSPWLRFAYRSPSLHVAIETAASLIAVFAALLVAGRARIGGRLGDVLLATALALFAATNLVFAAVPRLLDATETPALSTWAPLAVRLEAAALFALAALLPAIRMRRLRSAVLGAALAGFASFAGIGAAALALGDRLPEALDRELSPAASSGALVAGHPALLGSQIVGAALFAAAAVGFARASGSPLLTWLAPAAALLAIARVNYLLFPSIYSDWIYTGDLFRLGAYVLVLVGATLELRGYWATLAEAAVFEERRRLARDLHDGVAQELAFIVREAHGALPRHELASSAERALDEARRALAALTRSADEPLERAIGRAVEEVAARAGGRVQLELEGGLAVSSETRETLVRIAREAVANAVRHGGGAPVVVELSGPDPMRLRVADDGVGFDPAARRSSGHGLTSMKERAASIGAAISVVSTRGSGTEVTVVVP